MKRIHTAVGMLNAGVTLYQEFARRSEGSEKEKAISSSLFIPTVVTLAFGVEVGLKAVIEAQGDAPPHHHDLLKLYRKILPETQDFIDRFVSDRVPELSDVQTLLGAHRKSFETWRYLEDSSGPLVIPLETMAMTLEAIVLAHNTKYGIEVAEDRQDPQAVGDSAEELQDFVFEYIGKVFGSGT